jgi:nucleoside-diphosphate-sugar epimerase
MSRALIGHTGFVGGNLLRQTPFDELYNSSNIDAIRGRRFELVVCAGARAEKWRINAEPARDRAELERLTAALADVEAERLLLISTVDVYPSPVRVDEESMIDGDALSPYGWHRLELERWCRKRFETIVVRLPALFGPGLKKNVVYDLLHDHRVEQIHPDGRFQFYDVRRLWWDVEIALSAQLPLLNVTTEPISAGEVAGQVFGRELRSAPAGDAPAYDVRSRHAPLFGGRDGYLYERGETLEALARFVAWSRARKAA